MKRKLLVNALIAGTMLVVAPVWAHGGSGHGQWKHWEKHHRHLHRHHHSLPPYRERLVVREYVLRVPVYRGEPAWVAAPGAHIVMPSIFLPWSR